MTRRWWCTIPLPGGSPRSAKGVRLQDLTAHPWAGLPVSCATAGAQRRRAGPAPALTPCSICRSASSKHPVARALMAVRRILVAEAGRTIAGDRLDWLGWPCLMSLEGRYRGGFLNLSVRHCTAPSRPVIEGRAGGAVAHVAARLASGGRRRGTAPPGRWTQARQALRDALRCRSERGEKIDPGRNSTTRMRELQEALDRAPAGAGRADATRSLGADHSTRTSQLLDAQEMQRKAEQMRDAAREGRQDDARQQDGRARANAGRSAERPPGTWPDGPGAEGACRETPARPTANVGAAGHYPARRWPAGPRPGACRRITRCKAPSAAIPPAAPTLRQYAAAGRTDGKQIKRSRRRCAAPWAS